MAWWALRTADGPPPCASHRPARGGESWPGARAPSWPRPGCPAAGLPRTTLPRWCCHAVPCGTWRAACPACASAGATQVLASLVPAIIEQKVTGPEAQRAYRRLVLRYGEPAPGPGRLHLPPAAPVLAALPYFELHPLGLEQRRAVTLIRAAREAERLESAVGLPAEQALALLRSVPVSAPGPRPRRRGRPSAIRMPSAWATSTCPISSAGPWPGSRAAMTRRMLELLEPYRGQRARLCASWSSPGSCRRDTARACGLAPSSGSDGSSSG